MIRRYGLAVLLIAAALGVGLFARLYDLANIEVPLLLLAVAGAGWYTGTGPGIVAALLAILGFDYFFAEPLYSLDIRPHERPLFAAFIGFACLIVWFSSRRRRIEEDLRRARQTLENEVAERTRQAGLLDLTHDTIFVRDLNDVITYWNQGAAELYGWTAADAVGRHAHELLRTSFPVPLEEIHQQLLKDGRWEGELHKTKADGTRVTVASRWALWRDEQGRPVAILVSANDITERKQQEDALRDTELFYRRVLELAPDGMMVVDEDGVILLMNAQIEHLFGYAKDELIGQPVDCLVPEAVRARHVAHRDAFHRAPVARSMGTGQELQGRRRDGSAFAIEIGLSPLPSRKGQPSQVAVSVRDITERKRREREIERLNADLQRRTMELQASNRELEAFAYSVSHDLRAPLRHTVGYTELLQKSAASLVDDKSRRYIGLILDAAKHMGRLIDDLLAFSRIGRAETRTSRVSLEALVKETLHDLRPELEGRDVAWNVGALPEVHGDRAMLKVVLVNLVSNALKFTRTRPRAEIEIGVSDADRTQTVVFVRDNGVGFDVKYVDKLFGVFQRLHPADAFEGTGIGLATVQRIIHRHHGRVWAEGAVDRGATIYFSVPALPGEASS